MSTSKTRVNVSLSDELNLKLKKLALRDQVPTATKAERLIELAVEMEEDEVWDNIASTRDKVADKNYHSHDQAWK